MKRRHSRLLIAVCVPLIFNKDFLIDLFECCPGHYLIVNHQPSISWFNLSVIVNSVTKSSDHSIALNLKLNLRRFLCSHCSYCSHCSHWSPCSFVEIVVIVAILVIVVMVAIVVMCLMNKVTIYSILDFLFSSCACS